MTVLINVLTAAPAAALAIVLASENTPTVLKPIAALAFVLVLSVNVLLRRIWPVGLYDLYLIHVGQPGCITNLANQCMLANKDFWSIRDYIFWGQRTCILTSEKSVNDVLTNGDVFQRVKAPGDSITSPHSVLGAGGVSNTWKRLRAICRPFFNRGEFEESTEKVVQHVTQSVEEALKNAPADGVDLFQLVNRLVVEAHLLVILGVDSVPAAGEDIPVRDFMETDAISSKCMADIIDESLNVKMAEPKFSSTSFAPMMTWLTERLMLPADQLGGIEKILAEAQAKGEVSAMERLHNVVMYMIALAPSPAAFWTILHVYHDKDCLAKVREEGDEGNFAYLSMCVKETLRMYAPVPIMVTRYVRRVAGKKDPATLLKGHQLDNLKDGDRVLIPTIILQNDPNLWDKPNTYNPERFDAPKKLSLAGNKAKSHLLKGSGKYDRPRMQSTRSFSTKARFFPFGQGKHTCLGQPYAVWITMTITSTIFNNFDMEIEDTEGLLEKECSYQRIKDHVYTFPKAPFKAKIVGHGLHAGIDRESKENVKETVENRNSLFRKSMAVNMHDFSEFVQDNYLDYEDSAGTEDWVE